MPSLFSDPDEMAKFLSRHDLVHGEPLRLIQKPSTRHATLVEFPNGRRIFVKGGSPETVDAEASFLAGYADQFRRAGMLIPRLLASEPDQYILVLEGIAGRTLADLVTERDPGVPAALVRLSLQLCRLHSRFTDTASRTGVLDLLAPFEAWGPLTPQEYADMPGAEVHLLVAALQAVAPLVAELHAGWRPSSVIHGDLSLPNVLVSGNDIKKPNVHLIDWEFVRLGEPMWDVGSVFGHVLFLWLQSVRINQHGDLVDWLELADLPIGYIGNCLSIFWAGYARALGPSTADLHRAVQFAGIILMERARSALYIHGRLTPESRLSLELGGTAIRAPDRVIGSLFRSEIVH